MRPNPMLTWESKPPYSVLYAICVIRAHLIDHVMWRNCVPVGLPTQKVLNLLDEYGESPSDLYPSKYRGLPAHLRKQRVAKQDSK